MFAFVFESVGSGEWLVLLAVILIIIGPKNLPSAARKMGQVMSKLRRAADEFKRQLMTMDEEMKKTADEIKRDYIDIPEESAGDRAISEAGEAEDSADEPVEEYEGHDDYPDGYPEEDYYVMTDENGLEVASPSEESGAAAPVETPAEPPKETAPEAPEKTNGQDTGNTQGS